MTDVVALTELEREISVLQAALTAKRLIVSRIKLRDYQKAYQKRPEVRAKIKAYRQRPEVKARLKVYKQNRLPKVAIASDAPQEFPPETSLIQPGWSQDGEV
jgi:hypothetical protein